METPKNPKTPTPEMRQTIMVELLRKQTAFLASGHRGYDSAHLTSECEFICNYLCGLYKFDPETLAERVRADQNCPR